MNRGDTVSNRPRTPESSVENMCNDLKESSTLSPRTIRFYREEVNTIIKVFRKGNRNTMPWTIDKTDVKWLLDYYQTQEYTVQTRTGYISALRKWTAHYGNNVVKDMNIRWPVDMRPNADWLTNDQAVKLLSLPKSPVQDMIVHCELCLGMRRIEVLRLNMRSFNGCYVDVLGKGPQGGKPRRIPYHRDTDRVYRRYFEYREMVIKLARARYPASTAVPDELLIWSRGERLYSYSLKGEGVNKLLKDLAPGIEYPALSHHTLRRTFGRTMYRSNIPVPTIAKIMGHDSIEQCLKYLGIDLDDMTTAMNAFSLG